MLLHLKEVNHYANMTIQLSNQYLDIRLSKDGEIVMMHDLTLNRTTTGTGNVGDRDWHGYIDGLTTKTDPPQPIPRFKDIVRLLLRPEVVDRNMYMIVDIKVRK